MADDRRPVVNCPICNRLMKQGFVQAIGEVYFTEKSHKMLFAAKGRDVELTQHQQYGTDLCGLSLSGVSESRDRVWREHILRMVVILRCNPFWLKRGYWAEYGVRGHNGSPRAISTEVFLTIGRFLTFFRFPKTLVIGYAGISVKVKN